MLPEYNKYWDLSKTGVTVEISRSGISMSVTSFKI